MRKIKRKTKRRTRRKAKRRSRGIKYCIKDKTLIRIARVFYEKAYVNNCSELDVLLVCAGMKICNMRLPVYAEGISEVKYAIIISDLLQADLESFGVKVGRPIPNELGGYTYLVCR